MSLRLGVLSGQSGTHLVSGNGARWVSLQGVIGGANLVGQPGLHGAITRDQRPQSVAHHFAFTGVFTGLHLGLHNVRHVVGQCDAHLLGGSHGSLC